MNNDEFDRMLRDRHDSFVAELAVNAPPLPPRVSRVGRLRMFLTAVHARLAVAAGVGVRQRLIPVRSGALVSVMVAAGVLFGVAVIGYGSHEGTSPAGANAQGGEEVAATPNTVTPPSTIMPPHAAAPPNTVTMEIIEFQPNSAVLMSEGYETLRSFELHIEVNARVDTTLNYPYLEITLVGRTASIGPADSAIRLSWARANVVRDELIAYGLNARSIRTEGIGYNDPLIPDRDKHGKLIPEAAQRNRSVEIIVTKRL